MRIFLSKQYEDFLEWKITEVIEKFQVIEKKKILGKELVQYLEIFAPESALYFYFNILILIILEMKN